MAAKHSAKTHSTETLEAIVAFVMAMVDDLVAWLDDVRAEAELRAAPITAAKTPDAEEFDTALAQNIMGTVQMIGGAVITIAVIVVVVNEVLTIDAVANSTGPMSSVIDSLETTGASAMILLVVGLVVAAAVALLGFFRGGGGF